jgi:hypothetical protein
MSIEYMPRPGDEPALPSFENDPEYERATLDACVLPEPLYPTTIEPFVARVCGGGWLTAAADPALSYDDGRAQTLEVFPTDIIAATGVGKQGRVRKHPVSGHARKVVTSSGTRASDHDSVISNSRVICISDRYSSDSCLRCLPSGNAQPMRKGSGVFT